MTCSNISKVILGRPNTHPIGTDASQPDRFDRCKADVSGEAGLPPVHQSPVSKPNHPKVTDEPIGPLDRAIASYGLARSARR